MTAWKLNPFVVVALGVGVVECARSVRFGVNTRILAWLGLVALAGAIVFSIARN